MLRLSGHIFQNQLKGPTVISNSAVLQFQSYKFIQKPKEAMALSEQKIIQISQFMWRPHTTDFNSPLKIRQNNFTLDCTNHECAALPSYKPQNDVFIKPYVPTLLQKVKSQNLSSLVNLRIKKNCKIRSDFHVSIGSQKFKRFLADKMEATLKRTDALKANDYSSCRNSPSKENISRHKEMSKQKEKFLEVKFKCYKMKNRKGMPSKKAKNIQSFHQR